jgi:hypothetical protein
MTWEKLMADQDHPRPVFTLRATHTILQITLPTPKNILKKNIKYRHLSIFS